MTTLNLSNGDGRHYDVANPNDEQAVINAYINFLLEMKRVIPLLRERLCFEAMPRNVPLECGNAVQTIVTVQRPSAKRQGRAPPPSHNAGADGSACS